jgi:hypothetical protein
VFNSTTILNRGILAAIAVLSCLGCAGPALTTRPVHHDAVVFVGLASYADAARTAEVRHDHPADWSEADLQAILGRLDLQERMGLLAETRPEQAVFEPDEAMRLSSGLREGFRAAQADEWVVFALASPGAGAPVSTPAGAQEVAVTSGAFFVQAGRLHVIIANHREHVPSGPGGLDEIRANPLRPLKAVRGSLRFDPARYVVASSANWLGGSSGPSASEVVVDHAAFLASARRQPLAAPPVAQSKPDDSEAAALRARMERMQEEIARLKQQLAEQAEELARLKSRSSKKPPR